MSVFRKESAGIMIRIRLHLKIILEELTSQQYQMLQSVNRALHFFRTSGISLSNIYIFFPQPYFIDFSAEILHIICENFPKVVNIVF